MIPENLLRREIIFNTPKIKEQNKEEFRNINSRQALQTWNSDST